MKPLEILTALPHWAKASPGAILDSPAFQMTCRLGDESVSLRHAQVAPAVADALALAVTFGDEPHGLFLARSPRFRELDRIWDSRSEMPEPILLALVEKECGPFFQMLENAVRRQLRLTGLGSAEGGTAALLSLEVSAEPGVVFSMTRSDAVVAAFGTLRNIDLAHGEVRSRMLPSECEYAAFASAEADLASLAPGDAVLLPEAGTVSPRLVVDGRFVVDRGGVAALERDALAHVRAAGRGEISLGEVFDAVETPPELPQAEPGAQLKLLKDGRLVASGRLDSLADQLAFIVEG